MAPAGEYCMKVWWCGACVEGTATGPPVDATTWNMPGGVGMTTPLGTAKFIGGDINIGLPPRTARLCCCSSNKLSGVAFDWVRLEPLLATALELDEDRDDMLELLLRFP